MSEKLLFNIQFFADEEEVIEEETLESEETGEEEFTETEVDTNSKENTQATPQVSDGEKKKNAYYKQKRLEEKARKEELEKAKYSGTKEALVKAYNGVNPFTNETIEDDLDIQELLDMIDLKNSGSEDPQADYRKFKKQKDREIAKEKEKQKTKEEFYVKDATDFVKEYGEKYDLNKIIEDKDFLDFCGDELGSTPLATLFKLYLKSEEKSKEKRSDDLLKSKAMSQSSAGNPKGTNSNGNQNGDYFTLDEIKAMSQKQVEANYDKVERSLAYINRKK